MEEIMEQETDDLEERMLEWLRQTLAEEPPPGGVAEEFLEEMQSPHGGEQSDPEDLMSLWSAMTALSQDVRLQGRSFHDLQDHFGPLEEKLSRMLEAHEQVLETTRHFAVHHKEAVREAADGAAEKTRLRVAELLMDLRHRMIRGSEGVQQTKESLEEALAERNASRTFFQRLFAPSEIELPSLASLDKGYQLGLDRLDEIMAEWRIVPIEPLGQLFDPLTMNALDVGDHPDAEDGTVVEVFREGYTRDGKVLRHAQVKVCRK